jgi:hypothetical protein
MPQNTLLNVRLINISPFVLVLITVYIECLLLVASVYYALFTTPMNTLVRNGTVFFRLSLEQVLYCPMQ